jgi:putative flippase GtrA
VLAILRRPKTRPLLFAAVGGCCFLVQVGVLTALAAAGTSRPLANAIGFVISAQLNFALSSRLTWRDRQARTARARWTRLVSYNGTALLSLAVNTGVFALVYHRTGNLLAAALGVGCGMCSTYVVCHFLIFGDRAGRAGTGRPGGQPAAHPPAHRTAPAGPPVSGEAGR